MESATLQQALSWLIGERLTSIEFVLDYVQLRFDGPTLTILTSAALSMEGRTIRSDEYGFKDEVCRQIGRNVSAVGFVEDHHISFQFDNGAVLQFSLAASEYTGPEAGTFDIRGKWWVF